MSNYKIKKIITTQTEIEIEGTLNEFIGKQIARYRKIRGWGQKELHQNSGISRAVISNIETGKFSCTLKNLERICEVLECKSSDILPF